MISIALASYNGSKYIREQLDSILSQTYQDFELIICDDCSTDNTWQILEEYAEKDNRVKIFRNDTNLGFKKNFEKAISLSKGEYIALSDQDDVWTEDHLDILLHGMKDNVQIVCGRPLFVDENNKIIPMKYDYLQMDYVPQTNEEHARHIFLGKSSYQGASMLIKKSFFDIALPIPDDSEYHDNWFAALACFTGGLQYIDKVDMRYRRLFSSVTYTEKRKGALRLFIGKVLKNGLSESRLVFCSEIRKRCKSLSILQSELLDTFEKIHNRNKTFIGRIRNIPYMLRYFKSIFAMKLF